MRFYSASHIFILCTREEVVNRNVEGRACFCRRKSGTAVICTHASGIPDAVERQWRLVVPIGHITKSGLLIKLIDDKSLAINEGRNASAPAERGHYVDQICDVIYE